MTYKKILKKLINKKKLKKKEDVFLKKNLKN